MTNEKNNILEVRDLRISFRTPGGMVKAVRGINYELKKGETLAIVGESGSGKSVTSRALLGISAGNAVVESGEIIFNGQDLLKISEDDFHNIRGEKISMIFQDPLSSLNPIVKIGKQLTEAMLIKGKAKQKKAKKSFNKRLNLLKTYMDKAANAEKGSPEEQANAERIKKFDTFEYKHTELEGKYNVAKEALAEAADEIDYLVLCIEKAAVKNITVVINEIIRLSQATHNDYVVTDITEVQRLCEELKQKLAEALATAKQKEKQSAKKKGIKAALKTVGAAFSRAVSVVFKRETDDRGRDFTMLLEPLKQIRQILASAEKKTAPSFFAMAYYLTFSTEPLPELEIDALNEHLKKFLREDFMNDFTAQAEKALQFAFDESLDRKKGVLGELKSYEAFLKEHSDEKEILMRSHAMFETIEASINKLALTKDSVAYTFRTSMLASIKTFFEAQKANKKEQARYEREKQRFDTKVAAGKTPDFSPKEPSLIDLEAMAEAMFVIIKRLEEKYTADIENAHNFNKTEETRATINYLRSTAAAVVDKVTKAMAKRRALKIMEEVGIPEPRKRFNQYPFEFSGGMRQRIVIAIALTANPDILVCDEPTTALDVTIQAQILELINDLKKKHNLSVIFITHDLGVVANMADRIAVMYAGKIVETGLVEEVFYKPAHPYTWALLSSMPDLETTERLEAIPGTPPNMLFPPKGDAFAARNKYAMKIDFEEQPPMFKITDTHHAATWLLHPDAPHVEVPKIVTERIKRNKTLLSDTKAEGESK